MDYVRMWTYTQQDGRGKKTENLGGKLDNNFVWNSFSPNFHFLLNIYFC